MPEGLIVDKELLWSYDFSWLELMSNECINSGSIDLHIFQGMGAHIIVQTETIHDLLT